MVRDHSSDTGEIAFQRKGWTVAVDTLCGLYVMVEGDYPAESSPVFFGSEQAARDDWELEEDEVVLYAGLTDSGEVFELDPRTSQIWGPLRRPDR